MIFFRHLAVRLGNSILLLLAVIVLNFILIHSAPGDPAEVIAGEMGGATIEIIEEIRSRYGLDRPLWTQVVIYVRQIAGGDLGYSYYFNQPVSSLILRRIPPTLLLMIFSLASAAIIGVVLGVISSYAPHSVPSHLITFFSLAGYAAPVFWTGLMLMLLFGRFCPIFPVSGMFDIVAGHHGFAYVWDVLRHLALPSLTLILLNAAQFSRLSRASMLESLSTDYVRTARAKGLNERRVFLVHALRNALMPVVTMAGLQFGPLLGGAVVVETVFNWPGLGRLVFDSILRRDYPVLLGILFISAMMVILANIVTDALYRLIDPRVRGGPK
ncbi:MAG: ABC transporter permease [Deltaproteobacteria bacterium]|jgi:peptide/nickel transport system permease protein|nr:ABC transporter permease [Deltaproteobacteria bacterium]